LLECSLFHLLISCVGRGDLRYVDMARDVDLGMAKDVAAGMVKCEDGETEVQSGYFPRVHNGYKKDMDKNNNKNLATGLVNNMS